MARMIFTRRPSNPTPRRPAQGISLSSMARVSVPHLSLPGSGPYVHPGRLTAGTCPHGGLVQIMFLSKWVMAVGSRLIFQGVTPLENHQVRAVNLQGVHFFNH